MLDDFIETEYKRLCAKPGDINEHLAFLRSMAARFPEVVELGVREGVSTTALIAGVHDAGAGHVWSYDLTKQGRVYSLEQVEPERFTFALGNSLEINIPECGMLFIDTWHVAKQVYGELTRHAKNVGEFILLHDTVTFGIVGENGGDGLIIGINQFLSEDKGWKIAAHYENNNGLMVLERL